MKTVLILFGGQSATGSLSGSIDVIAAQYAVRGLPETLDGDWRIAATDHGAIPDMLRILTQGRADAPGILDLGDTEAVLPFATATPPEAILVIAGNEETLALADAVAAAAPDAVLIPVASTGGAAAAIYARDPEGYGADLEREFVNYARPYRRRFPDIGAAPAPRMR